MEKDPARVKASRSHGDLSVPVEVFLAGRVKLLAFARLLAGAKVKAPKQGVKKPQLEEKPPGKSPKIVLSYVPDVVKRVTRQLIVLILVMTGRDNVKT